MKYTVITGASSGIGKECAKAFANRGENLILVARRQAELETLKAEILTQFPQLMVVVQVADLSIIAQCYELYQNLQQYELKTWINNAGFGNYQHVAVQDLEKIQQMLQLNIEALTILSTLFVRDYHSIAGTQLINVSSAGGYTIVPTAITYCASKFYVSAFTEGLAHELKESNAAMKIKLLAPAATQTSFGQIANDVADYDYDHHFGTYHTAAQMAQFLLALYDSEAIVGRISRETFEFQLAEPVFSHAFYSANNQKG